MNATQPVLFYGTEIWANALGKEVYRNFFVQGQRRGTLGVVVVYRVSESIVMVNVRVTPIFPLLSNVKPFTSTKAEAHGRCLLVKDDNIHSGGRWITRLISSLSPWLNLSLPCFQAGLKILICLHKVRRVQFPDCVFCNSKWRQSRLFSCGNWDRFIGIFTQI